MQASAIGLQENSGTAGVRRLLYMYGAATQLELNNFLEVNCIDAEERKHVIKARWREAAEVFRNLVRSEGGLPDSITTRNLPPEAESFLAGLQRNQAFLRTFSNYPCAFEEVEIDKIVACQRTVHLDFTEHILANYEHSPENLLKLCLNPAHDQTPLRVGRTAANAFTFSSQNPGLRFLGNYEQAYQPEMMELALGGQPVHAVVLLFGYGLSTVNVYRVGKRIILNNGFHRLYTLKTLGITHAPVVVQSITQPDIELPPQIAELPRDYLTSAARPALMKDFFDRRLVCEVKQQNFLKALQVGWGFNESLVPR